MLLIIILLVIIHYCLINGSEKIMFDLFSSDKKIKLRPNEKCYKTRNYPTYCLGMPSGHTEITTIIMFILYKLNYFSLQNTNLIIGLMCLQRIITKKHTLLQTLVGIILGIIYANIYLKVGLSYKSVLLALLFVFIYINIIINKIDNQLKEKIPDWVDKSMIKYIEDKKNMTYKIKFVSILSSPIRQSTFLFLSWKDLEHHLDIIIDNIKKSNIKFDAVVGIKTGGAIISDYVSSKLKLKNYKIKLSNEKYNCKKSKKNFFDNYFDTYVKKNKSKYITCEGINDNLENKNVILIDESVSSGQTMNAAIKYLSEKKTNIIYPTSIIATNNVKLINNLELKSILHNNYFNPVWCWGYDN